jgi:hypothetical protein
MTTKEIRHLETYLGVGAYVYLSDWDEVVFYTSNGITETNTVVLDTDGLRMLMNWLPQMQEFIIAARKRQQAAAAEEEA